MDRADTSSTTRRRSSNGLPCAAPLFALALALGGCGRACKKDHPYVPYAVDDGAASSATPDAADPPQTEDDAGAFGTFAEPALAAPAGAQTWTVEGVTLTAPADREIVFAIVRDFDGDGKSDALAVVRAPAAAEAPNEVGAVEVVHYAGGPSGVGAPTIIATAPPSRSDAGCTPLARMERIGPRSAFVEVGSACARGGSSRALFVVRLSKSPAVAFNLGVLDPPGAPKLAVHVDGADRDRDGIDDVTLHVTIEGGAPPFEPGPRLEAKVAFFDRPAGPSRDTDEPEASLRAIATHATARAGKAKDAAVVPILVQQMRMLYRAMCIEGGAPRLVKLGRDGAAAGTIGAVSCGSSKPLEDAGLAEVRALVTQADALGDANGSNRANLVLRAVIAAEAVQIAPATKTAARTTELASLLARVAPFVQARDARALPVIVPTARAPHPEWGRLAFEPSGKLLVRAASHVLRFDTESGESIDGDVPAWPTQVLSPDGKSRWLEAYHACEGVALRATFAPTGADGEMADVLLPIAPPLGSRCAGGRGEAAATLPIAWGSRGLEALVAGRSLLIRPETAFASVMAAPLGEAPPLGSPRSPGGRAVAVATAQGVLVTTSKAARYRSPELEPYAELGQCTTTDDGSRIACVKRSKVVVATFDPL